MKIKDLPDDTDLRKIKVRLPEEFKDQARMAGLNTNQIYLYSSWSHGIWVKTSLNSSKVYPITSFSNHKLILDWEVV